MRDGPPALDCQVAHSRHLAVERVATQTRDSTCATYSDAAPAHAYCTLTDDVESGTVAERMLAESCWAKSFTRPKGRRLTTPTDPRSQRNLASRKGRPPICRALTPIV